MSTVVALPCVELENISDRLAQAFAGGGAEGYALSVSACLDHLHTVLITCLARSLAYIFCSVSPHHCIVHDKPCSCCLSHEVVVKPLCKPLVRFPGASFPYTTHRSLTGVTCAMLVT